MVETISLQDTNYFSSLILDYVNQNQNLQQFYSLFPTKENYIIKAKEKLKKYNGRNLLIERLNNQLSDLNLTILQQHNLEFLSKDNTVTITTGHQLNLFTGPIFFFYKILQVICLCEELNKEQQEIKFVPLFWMATEDHDFSEINHFYKDDCKIIWERDFGGPVGRLSTDGLKKVFESFILLIPSGNKRNQLWELIKTSYLSNSNLASATKHLVNNLFGEYGILILDGDDKALKKSFSSVMREEILKRPSYNLVNQQSEKLSNLGYKKQVTPREINLFYMPTDNVRKRIVKQAAEYSVVDTSITFTEENIINELNKYPEKFSPNVILRPLYQEFILPNVAYVGGGGEISYWLQLKTMFDHYNVDLPLLKLRNSVLILTDKEKKKQLKLKLTNQDLFRNSQSIIKERITKESDLVNQLPLFGDRLNDIFMDLEKISNKTDSSFQGMINAQKAKQLKGFENIEKRLVKAEIKKNEQFKNSIIQIIRGLKQDDNLQERKKNFSDFDFVDVYQFIRFIKDNLKPFEQKFILMTIDKLI